MQKISLYFFPRFWKLSKDNSVAKIVMALGLAGWIAGQTLIIFQFFLYDLGHGVLLNVWTASFWNFDDYIIENIIILVLIMFLLMTGFSFIPSKGLHVFLIIFYGFWFSASFYFGAGWYIGAILGLAGITMIGLSPSISGLKFKALSKKTSSIIIRIGIICMIAGSVAAPIITYYPQMPPYYKNSALYEGMSGSPNSNNTLYILPIWENWGTYESDIDYFRQELGNGSQYVRIGFSVSCWYMCDLKGAAENWSFDPEANLYLKLNFSLNYNMPILFHMNGGNWGTECWKNVNKSSIVTDWWKNNDSYVQWDQFNRSVPADIADDQMPLKPRLFTLSKYSPIFHLREQNIKIAGQVIANFANEHPDLFVGVSMDSEIHLETTRYSNFDPNVGDYESYFDYNPLVIREFQEWLQANYSSINDLNKKSGLSFSSFDDVDPPRVAAKGNPWWEEWTRFRIWLVRENVNAEARWLREVGISKEKIYSHQILSSPNDDHAKYKRCDPLETADISNGNIGITRYGLISPNVFKTINDKSGFNWGIFEWNIWSDTDNTYENYMYMLKSMYQFGVRVICPYAWFEGTWPVLQIRNNTEFKQAIRDFSVLVGDSPRGSSPAGFLSYGDFCRGFLIENEEFLSSNTNAFILLIIFGVLNAILWPIHAILSIIRKRKEKRSVEKIDK
ncbi:MAG: beta-galactosidase [Promethearchaeota archaeon]